MNRGLAWVALMNVLVVCPWAYGDDKAELKKRLQHAADMSSLDDPALKPWHLKLDVQLYDDKGQPSEKGTIEEWWTPEKDKRVYAMPSYSATEIRDGKSLYRTAGAANVPYLLDAMRRDVVHPVVPEEVIDKSALEVKAVSFGKTKLDCIMMSKAGSSYEATVGMVQTYCLNQNNDQLRASWFDPEVLTVNGTGNFQEKDVAVASSITVFQEKAISELVVTLSGFVPDAMLFAHENNFEDRTAGPVWLSPGTAESRSIKKVPPKYPDEAKKDRIAGIVLLEATIGKDGHVGMLKVTGHPDANLTKASLDAVKDWVYKPYVVDGVAMEVQTRIKIRFNFGIR